MICDKCGKEVPPENDATIIEAYAFNSPLTILACQSRHFLATEDCEGSPSRAQYIQGQPRDERGYAYVKQHEAKWRAGYAKAQRRTK